MLNPIEKFKISPSLNWNHGNWKRLFRIILDCPVHRDEPFDGTLGAANQMSSTFICCTVKVYTWNIPILPEAFLTFASKSSCGPSFVANGQKDHKCWLFWDWTKKEEKEHGETIKLVYWYIAECPWLHSVGTIYVWHSPYKEIQC